MATPEEIILQRLGGARPQPQGYVPMGLEYDPVTGATRPMADPGQVQEGASPLQSVLSQVRQDPSRFFALGDATAVAPPTEREPGVVGRALRGLVDIATAPSRRHQETVAELLGVDPNQPSIGPTRGLAGMLPMSVQRAITESVPGRILGAVQAFLGSHPGEFAEPTPMFGAASQAMGALARPGRAVAGAVNTGLPGTWISPAMEAIERAPQERATAQQWLGMLRKGGGLNKAEDIGLENWLSPLGDQMVTRDEVAQFVEWNRPRLAETVLRVDDSFMSHRSTEHLQTLAQSLEERAQMARRAGDPAQAQRYFEEAERYQQAVEARMLGGSGGAPKYESYTQPGGTNYQEILIREAARPGRYQSNHWDEPNVLAHLRTTERTINGDRTLFIEELQSDWHQAGRTRGYRARQGARRPVSVRRSDTGSAHVLDENGNFLVNMGRREAPDEEILALAEERLRQSPDLDTYGVPDAPFKRTEDWVALTFRRALQEAAEKGHDRVAWVSGEQAADLYDLRKQVSRIEYRPDNTLIAYDLDGATVLREVVGPDGVAEYIGKEPAERLLAARPRGETGGRARVIEGDDLSVGGEGMVTFYDKIVPGVVRKEAKRLGVEIEPVSIRAPSRVTATQTRREADGTWSVIDRNTGSTLRRGIPDREGARRASQEIMDTPASQAEPTNLSIRLTPAAREKILREGQRLGAAPLEGVTGVVGAGAGATAGATGAEEGNEGRDALIGGAIGGALGFAAPGIFRHLAESGRSGHLVNPFGGGRRALAPEARVARNVAIVDATRANGGATFSPDGRNLIGTDGHSVALRPGDDWVRPANADNGFDQALVDQFEEEFAEDLAGEGRAIGTWVRDWRPQDPIPAPPSGRVVVFDVAEVVPDRERAFELARNRNQDGIFNLADPENGYLATPPAPRRLGDQEDLDMAARALEDLDAGVTGAPGIIRGSQDMPLFDTSVEALERSFIEDARQAPIDYMNVSKGKRLEAIRRRFTPEKRAHLHRIADEMRSQYPAAQFWYATAPLRERFIGELGTAEGIDAFNLFIRRVAATSPRTKVLKNIIYASRNQPVMSTQAGLLARANANVPFGPGAPKVSSFVENLMGNLRPLTGDVHFSDVVGGPPPTMDVYGEYDRLFHKLAEEAGVPTGNYQATIWPAGTTNYDPSPFLTQVDRAVEMAARRQGISREEAFRRFARGDEALGGIILASVAAQINETPDDEDGPGPR